MTIHTLSTHDYPDAPTQPVSAKKLFGLKPDMELMAFDAPSDQVPAIDDAYVFEPEVTRALLMGFKHNRRALVQGYHGTGKSTHIEQIAARLNWPCVRINFDSHVSRLDLIGRDVISVKDGKQITEFAEGLLPWAIQRPIALVLDEYDAARPDVMFVIQRVLEAEGKLTLLDQNRIITPHPYFRLFATTNTIGLGDNTGIYHGTQPINQGQMDRWQIAVTLNYLDQKIEFAIVRGKVEGVDDALINNMIALANLTRAAFINGDIATVMSPRTVIHWAENTALMEGDIAVAFKLSFLNKCDENDRDVIGEMYQRAMGEEIPRP